MRGNEEVTGDLSLLEMENGFGGKSCETEKYVVRVCVPFFLVWMAKQQGVRAQDRERKKRLAKRYSSRIILN